MMGMQTLLRSSERVQTQHPVAEAGHVKQLVTATHTHLVLSEAILWVLLMQLQHQTVPCHLQLNMTISNLKKVTCQGRWIAAGEGDSCMQPAQHNA